MRSGPSRRTWTRPGRRSGRSTWCGRPRPCTTWPTPTGSWPTSSARSARAGCSPSPSWLVPALPVRRPRRGLEARCHALLDEARARDLPHIGDDWGTRLGKAGFAVEQDRTFAIDLTPPLPAAAGRYAWASLRRARTGLEGRLSDADLATLDALLDEDGPESILRRDDLRVRTTRTLVLARRPYALRVGGSVLVDDGGVDVGEAHGLAEAGRHDERDAEDARRAARSRNRA